MKVVRLLIAGSLALAIGWAGMTTAGAAPAGGAAAAASGEFSALTYNVAGLPEPLSSGNPAANTPRIGELVNAYDIVHVQEDFNYHAALYAADDHPFATPTSGGVPFGSGLNAMSSFPYQELERVKWSACNGTDCLTPKGFTFARMRMAEGVYVDFYNAHPNAGSTDPDLAARRANVTQLSRFVAAHSAGNAVVLMGDTNTRYTRAGDNIRELLAENNLTDVWVEKVRGGQPPAIGSPALVCDPANVTNECEVVDKILYRGSRHVRLRADAYNNEHGRFLDPAGQPLSDHYPHLARFSWTLAPDLRMSDLVGGPHGSRFTDVDALSGASAVRRLSVRAGSRVDRVAVQLRDGRVLAHGGGGGSERSLDLAAGEYLTGATLCTGKKDGHTRIFFAEFRTSTGRTLSGGVRTGNRVNYTAPAGWQISGFHGRSADEVDMLGLIYTPLG